MAMELLATPVAPVPMAMPFSDCASAPLPIATLFAPVPTTRLSA